MDLIRPFSILVLFSHVLLLSFLVYYLLARGKGRLLRFIARHRIPLAFGISTPATLGSLGFSEIMGLVPCELCWYQRIFMYPLPVILLVAWWRNDQSAWRYAVPLAAIGSIISVYHYYVQLTPADACTINGPSCAAISFAFGYITIPIMSLTASVLVLLLAGLRTNSR